MQPEQLWMCHKKQTSDGVELSGLSAFLIRSVMLFLLALVTIQNVSADNVNHQRLQAVLPTICNGLQNINSPTAQQQSFLETCGNVQVGVDQGFTLNLERLVTEETFIFQDSIVSLNDARTQNMLRRLNQLRHPDRQLDSTRSNSGDAGDQQTNQQPISVQDHNGLEVYAQARTLIAQYETAGQQMDHDSFGFAIGFGADYRIHSGLLAGASMGFVRQETDFFNIDGDAYANAGNLSLYGSWLDQSIGYADVVLDLGYHRFNMRRKTNVFSESRQFALAKTDALSTSVVATAGRDFSVFGFAMGPYVRLNLLRAEIDGYREETADGSSDSGSLLRVRSHTADSRRVAFGGQFSREFGRRVKLIPQLRLELVKEFVDAKSDIEANFQADVTNSTVRVSGDTRDTEFANSALGLTLKFRSNLNASVFVVSRWLDEHYTQHWIKLGMDVSF